MQFTVYANSRPAERAARLRSLTFPDILSDPMVRLVMKADGVDPEALESELSDIAASLEVAETGRTSCPLLAC
jgi:hypothetical protein